MIGSARSRVDESASDAGNQETVVDLELNSMKKLLVAGVQHLVESLGLSNCAGETVKDKAVDKGQHHQY